MASHIVYQMINGIEYARLATSTRVGAKVKSQAKTLGRVLDKEKGIYRSRERGVFTYNHATGEYGLPPASFVDTTLRKKPREKLILDFGDAYFLHRYIEGLGLMPALETLGGSNKETLNTIIMYYVLCETADCYAQTWYEGSYARLLYPQANLTSQGISELFCSIGNEGSYREFFKEYDNHQKKSPQGAGLFMDSTALLNSIFDAGKTNMNKLPPHLFNEERVRGNFLIALIASEITKKLQKELKGSSLNLENAFQLLRNQKCMVYADRTIPQEAVKKVNNLYKKFGMECPKTIRHKT